VSLRITVSAPVMRCHTIAESPAARSIKRVRQGIRT
jgi:hypothetical protein